MKTKFLSLVIAVSLLTIAAPSMAQQTAPAQGARQGHRGGGPGRLMKQLNLSPAQQAEVKKIMEGTRAKMMAIHNDAKLTDAQKKAAMMKIHKGSMAQVMKILNPTQRAQLKKMMAERKAQHQNPNRNPGKP